jgi:hypothetical protein
MTLGASSPARRATGSPARKGRTIMRLPLARGAALALALFVAMAVAAAPAGATLTPVNGRFVGHAGDTQMAISAGNVRCATSTISGTINGAGTAVSGEVDFSNNGRTTCITAAGGSCTVVTGGGVPTRMTLRSTSSVSRSHASGDLVLDTDFTYSIDCSGFSCTISGTQTARNAWTITGQHLTILAQFACSELSPATLRATYTITDPARLTIS